LLGLFLFFFAKAEGFGIGFMALTLDVNAQLLNDCFELGAFHGLCKPHENDVLHPPKLEMDEEQIETKESTRTSLKENSNAASKSQLNSQVNISSPIQVKHKLSEAGLMQS
jgi:hypothetical protein